MKWSNHTKIKPSNWTSTFITRDVFHSNNIAVLKSHTPDKNLPNSRKHPSLSKDWHLLICSFFTLPKWLSMCTHPLSQPPLYAFFFPAFHPENKNPFQLSKSEPPLSSHFFLKQSKNQVNAFRFPPSFFPSWDAPIKSVSLKLAPHKRERGKMAGKSIWPDFHFHVWDWVGEKKSSFIFWRDKSVLGLEKSNWLPSEGKVIPGWGPPFASEVEQISHLLVVIFSPNGRKSSGKLQIGRHFFFLPKYSS